ncbi:unnamed protein product [Aureobasidium mustum]|uniref:DNA polymerase delta subunit 4 n=1 Tax=Aureobasidium mustum TaxID=2773714 RepID=A0A9N8PB04_9PEZI|nr:unnamed protein product [Aureobasidium mustum]
MAPKRRISTPSAAQRNQQATISFSKQGLNRVTKNTAQRDSKITKLESVSTHAISQPTTADAAIEEQADAELVDIKAPKSEPQSGDEPDDYEKRAIKITNAQIKKYWQQKEAERKSPRVHQQGLGVSEKILREFDMSGQYGRWRRANTLGLNPPIEVLAVLLKTSDKDKSRMQRAHVDELMSSRFIET